MNIANDDVCGFSGNKGRGSLEKHKYRATGVEVGGAKGQTFEKVEAVIFSSEAKVLSKEVPAPERI